MAQDCIWLWDDTNKLWVKAQCDANGKLQVSGLTFPTEYPLPAAQVADLKVITSYPDPVISQTDPEQLKHIPHGYYAAGTSYLPYAVDSAGKLLLAIPSLQHLDDIDDVYVPSPTDEYLLYWDAPNSRWACRALVDADIPAAIARDTEVTTAVSTHTAIAAAHFSNVITITFIIDGGGSAITTGQKGHLEIPFACTLTAWTLAADVAGAIVIDVWKDTYANFPPTNNDAMPGGGKEPTIAATNQKAQDTDISDWTTVAIAAGDILAFNVDSCTTITRVTLSLKATKT
jgi:hypothetical protein